MDLLGPVPHTWTAEPPLQRARPQGVHRNLLCPPTHLLSTQCQHPEGRALFCSLLCPTCLNQCLAHSRPTKTLLFIK